ncbi:MAG: hypothetical protein ACMUIU_12700 [bacterium]
MSKIIFKSTIFLSLLFLGFYFFVPLSVAQGINPWTKLNINAGQINDIAIDPCNPSKMFVASYLGGGLFMTEDGGNHWQEVLTGHEGAGIDTEEIFRNTTVDAVKIASPPNNNVIWVAHDLWIKKSIDGGKTWTHIKNETMQLDCPNCGSNFDYYRYCKSLAIHPSDPDIVLVGTGGPYGSNSPGAIYKTEDGGSAWTKSTLPPDPNNNTVFTVADLAINPDDPNIIWAVTKYSLYRSEDRGNNWTWIMILVDTLNTCYDIEIKPNNPNEIFIGSYEGIFRVYCDQNSNEWQSDPVAPASKNVRALAFAPQNPEVLYAAWRNRFEGNIPMVARSLNGGVDWEIYPVDYQFKTLEVHPANNDLIFGGDFDLGVYKSSDHGQTWTPVNNGINAVRVYDIDIDPNSKGHILAATSAGLFEKKEDKDWTLISEFEYTTVFSVAFHPTIPKTYYAGIRSQVAKTTDGGVNWTLSNKLDATNLSNYVSDIAISPISVDLQNTVIFISIHAYDNTYGEIYKSIDGGDTFTRILEGERIILEGENKKVEKYSFNTVAVDPSDPNHIFAGGGNFTAPLVYGDLWESSDGGVNWIRAGLQGEVVNSLLIDPDDPHIIYAGCGASNAAFIPLYKSVDGGKTFLPSFNGMRELLVPLYGIWGEAPNNFFIVGEYGDIIHYNGTLSLMISNTRKTLKDIWGASPNDMFAVGKEGVILHYDGVWSVIDNWKIEDFNGVWGTSPTNVFAVGSNGTILHYNGIWLSMDSNTTEDLMDVWGTSPTDVFAVGSSGTILHYNGAWSSMESNTTEDLNGVWGTSSTDVFAVGSNGAILHYNGDWSAMDSNTMISLSKIWGSSPTDIFVAGNENTTLHYDGNSWTKMVIGIPGEDFQNILGFSGSDIFAIGNKGGILHYDGSAWDMMDLWWSARNSVVDLEFHPQNKNIIYAGTSGTGAYISLNKGENWQYLGKPDYFVFAIAASSLYAGTEGGLWQCTGTGIITGQIRDPNSNPVDNAVVFNDWVRTRSINGEYLLVSPAGICNVAAITDDYIYKLARDITVYGGDVTRVDFHIKTGVTYFPSLIDSDSDQDDGEGKTCFIDTAARF